MTSVPPAKTDLPARTDRYLRRLIVLLCVLVLGVAWWWPRLSGRGSELGVLVVGNGQFEQSRDAIERQVRGLGLSVQWDDTATSWCDAAELLPQLLVTQRPQRIVASFVATGSCADGVAAVAKAVASSDLVVQLQPGLQSEQLVKQLAALGVSGVTWADPTALLPALGTDAPCSWWDDCTPGGTIAIRLLDATLTDAGAQRVARTLAAVLP